MDWFEALFGFEEATPDTVRKMLAWDGTRLHSLANGRNFECGTLEIPTLDSLRKQATATGRTGTSTAEEWVIDATELHTAEESSGALIQVASQFNLLEMISPGVTPENGISGYIDDLTQGPACAMAAAAGTVFRCHLVPMSGGPGQTQDRQIDCIAKLGQALGNQDGGLWKMKNGYALATADGLETITTKIKAMSSSQRDDLMGHLEIGLQLDTEVTCMPGARLLSQAFCSALPVSYSDESESDWQAFARLVLDGAYEATLAAGVLNAERTGNPAVFLTLLGGGAFGNPNEWIFDALRRALDLYRHRGLRVVIVSYRSPNPNVAELLSGFQKTG